MSDLLNTAASTLTPAAAGTHIDISFTPAPGIRNNWDPKPVQVSGTLDAVRVYQHGSVRIVVDGREHYLPGHAPVRVAPHLRVPDTAVAATSRPAESVPATRSDDEVRAGVIGKRVGVGDLGDDHLGRTVEFDFRGARFYGELTSVRSALGMYAVTLDGAERFLFDDDQSLIVRIPAEASLSAPAAEPTSTASAAAGLVEVAVTSPVTVAPPAAAVTAPAAWVPVPADELEFV
ncbi:hypothetical protein ACWGJ9_10785 [Curtobacterium citreum]